MASPATLRRVAFRFVDLTGCGDWDPAKSMPGAAKRRGRLSPLQSPSRAATQSA